MTHLHIQNFVIVKSLSLDFQKGLHVLTGETGAGKSIWIDAIEIGLGGRTDAHIIYPGEKSCDITLCFDLQKQPVAKAWLESHDLPNDDECIIRRLIDHDKPSRTTINGVPIPQQLTRMFAQKILCIHGQHQHQQLLKVDSQRELLDHFGHNEDLLLRIQTNYEEWKSLDRNVQSLHQQSQNKSSDLKLWQYQLDELSQLHIEENEYEKLFAQYQQLHHSKQFASTLNEAFLLVNGDENFSTLTTIQKSHQKLQLIHSDDPKIENIKSLLQTAIIHLDEASDALQQYCFNIDFGAEQLEKIEHRLSLLQNVARKHHVDPSELSDVILSLQHKIEQLTQSDEIIVALEKKKGDVVNDYQKNARALSTRREKSAKKLSTEITQFMQDLGMSGGEFKIDLQKNDAPIHPLGNETVRFLIATNSGQSPHELSHVVSGGELSRLSLMMQVLTAQQKNTPTLIFDEVDVGIGGKTADLVGRLLRKLSEHSQVLCVTHLPQVAACGHHHFYASKITDGKNTSTHIVTLTKAQRADELARMLSGAEITEKSILHANELLGSIVN